MQKLTLQAKRTKMKRLYVVIAVVILFIITILTGYSWSQHPKISKVTLQLKWIYNAGFVGDLVAKEKGFWKDEGLDVTVRPGGVGTTPIRVVIAGDAEFGVATGDQLLFAAEEKIPIVAVALVYQQNPLAWIVRADSNIKSATNFKGKRIGLSFIDDEPLFNAMLAQVGLSVAARTNCTLGSQ
jgi:NitT/TauT family transport system substrate-binding protein